MRANRIETMGFEFLDRLNAFEAGVSNPCLETGTLLDSILCDTAATFGQRCGR
jgi:hypothetical protein